MTMLVPYIDLSTVLMTQHAWGISSLTNIAMVIEI